MCGAGVGDDVHVCVGVGVVDCVGVDEGVGVGSLSFTFEGYSERQRSCFCR